MLRVVRRPIDRLSVCDGSADVRRELFARGVDHTMQVRVGETPHRRERIRARR